MIMVIGGMASVAHFNQPEEVFNDKPEVIEIAPDWANDEDAVAAAQAVLERKRLEAELASLNARWASTTASYEAEKERYEAAKTQLEKDLGQY